MDGADWADDEPFEPRPPLPPEDRVWRHPSELAASSPSGPLTSAGFVADEPVRWGRMTGLFVVATAGAVLVAFAFHLAFRPGPSGGEAASLSAVPTAVVSAGATAVVTTAFPLPTARAWLGIAGSDVGGVATVGEVKPDSPAAAAGLLVDDQVLAVDRDPVEGMQDLVAAIGRYAPGDQCILTLRRDGQAVDVTVVLGGST